MTYIRSRNLAAACACILGLASANSLAQTTPAPAPKPAAAKSAATAGSSTEIEEVIVTGSFIATNPDNSAISTQTFKFEDLQNMGRPSNLDLVKNITEVGYSVGELNRNNGYPIDAETINLRSLGPRFTTVVFNNRRFPEQFSPGVGRFNNIQSIPNAAIGSVEVLRTGGAAIYGADAVAGVVNYITRKDVHGIELNADYRYIADSNGDYSASALGGWDVWGGNFMVVFGWQHRSKLEQRDRDFSNKQYLENPFNGVAGGWNSIDDPPDFQFQRPLYATNTQTTYTAAGNLTNPLLPLSPTNPIIPGSAYVGQRQMGITGVVRDPGCKALGGYLGWSATPSPVCMGQVRAIESLVEHSDDYSLYSEYNVKFDNSMKFHWEGLAYYRELPDINVQTRNFPTVYPLIPTSITAGKVNSAVNYTTPGTNPAVG